MLQKYGFLSFQIANCSCCKNIILNGSQLAKLKKKYVTCPHHKIYRLEAVGLKNSCYTWKIMIFVKMWNLGQFYEKFDILSTA